ncbi:MAG: hypothetical protein M3070_13255 [Actinomycetota bacterium]|nr:hypothetical protein [Actinomycetota bacterium]
MPDRLVGSSPVLCFPGVEEVGQRLGAEFSCRGIGQPSRNTRAAGPRGGADGVAEVRIE